MASLETIGRDAVMGHADATLQTWQAGTAEGEHAPPAKTFSAWNTFGAAKLFVLLARLARKGRWKRTALRLALAARAIAPRFPAAHIEIGKAQVSAGKSVDALRALTIAASLDGAGKEGNWELARLLLRLERGNGPPALIRQYRDQLFGALSAASNSTNSGTRAQAAAQLSDLSHQLGDTSRAMAASELAISLAPRSPLSLGTRIHALLATGDFHEATRQIAGLQGGGPGLASLPGLIEILLAPQRPVVDAPHASVLIAVGGGIGDMLHVTPTIRNIVSRGGERVDVLLAADHRDAGFLLRNSNYVNRVWNISPAVLGRHFEKVFLTYSFGKLRLPFNAEKVLISRGWRAFQPGHLNETLFNMEAVKALLGIPYEAEDATRYFAGELQWLPTSQPLVGLHAGSKGGRWLSKRWPHFSELAARLKARAITVASFGTPDEYVEGTQDRTGGSIEEMSRAMMNCNVFVSNDSGPMHIASATGMPVLALYAPTDPFTHLPLAGNVTALALQKSCAPCEVKNHPYFATGACRCVGEISVNTVEEKTLGLLAASSRRATVPSGAKP